jgi:hypothetical protein
VKARHLVTYTRGFSLSSSLQRKNIQKPTLEHIHHELDVAFPQEVHQAADIRVVGASELLPTSIEEQLAFSLKQDLDRPPAKATTGFPQLYPSRVPDGEKLRELLWEFLCVERVIGHGTVKSKLIVEAAHLLFLR